MTTLKKLKLTEKEYLSGEHLAELKHEFIDGEAYAMAGTSVDHNRISGNLYAELSMKLKGSSCEPFFADIKVKTDRSYFYPDVMVVCEQHQDDTAYVKNAPKLIVEVLSKSTRVFDHSVKQSRYLNIPSLEYYVLIEQDFCEVSVLSRAAGFIPQYYYLGDNIEFPLLELAVAVNDIYDRIDSEDKQLYLEKLINERLCSP